MKSPKNQEEKELGFGRSSNGGFRLITPEGHINVKRKGLPFFRPYDTFHALITMPWVKLLLLFFFAFIVINLVFATGYYFLDHGALSSVDYNDSGTFWDAFFFSVQTITTVGYGTMSPISFGAKILSSLESFLGVLGLALVTGLLYGRFSRPEARILYAKNALIAPFKDGKAFMFKMANERSTKLIEAEANVTVSYLNDSGERSFNQLELQLNKINFLALTWTVVHPINEDSPILGFTEEDFASKDVEFIILIKAFDDSFAQTVYSRMSYKYSELVYGAKYKSSIQSENHQLTVNLKELDDFEMVGFN